ncbi:MAG: TetR/AcrR family transcriptional regulator [Bacteroidia bacterium]|nr:TetR/AcrR family transcriptional regulator [Bacteroidia bacterium]
MIYHDIKSDSLSETELKILSAARKIFIRKGLDGARMQEIANEAGINKALVHYYFRNKQKLFEAVFTEVFRNFLPQISGVLKSEIPLTDKIEAIVGKYIDFLQKNPYLPMFVMNEINRNPDKLANLLKSNGIEPEDITGQIKNGLDNIELRDIKPEHLIVNILSLCIFPFAAKSMIEKFLFKGDLKKFNAFFNERKSEVTRFIINSIVKQ